MSQSLVLTFLKVVSTGLGWWLSELSFLVPGFIRRGLTEPSNVAIVSVEGTEVAVKRFVSNDNVEVSRYLLDKIDAAALPADSPLGAAKIALPKAAAFVHQFQVPIAAQAKLGQAVAFEVERRSPFRKGDAVFGYSVIGKSDDGRSLNVEWATIPTVAVDKAKIIARKLGYYPVAVGLASDNPKELRQVFFKQKQPVVGKIGTTTILALLILVLAGAYALGARLEKAATLQQQVEEVKATAQNAQIARNSTEKMQAALNDVIAHMRYTRPVDIVREVTVTLPKDTWLSQLEIKNDQLKLVGYSASASGLLEKFAKVAIFNHPHFDAPITQANLSPGAESSAEHFDIGMTIHNRPTKGAEE
jgi:general secretion pathway protein L